MNKKIEKIQPQTITTAGGAYVAGSVHAAGDFIGRDAYYGYTAEQVCVLIAEIRREDQPHVWDGRVPFVGLASFREADAHFFFGRERLVDRLLDRLGTARFLCVSGPSGSGKSSLVRAGLLHALRLGRLEGSDKWPVADLTPRHDPMAHLAQAMARIAQNPAAAEYLQKHGRSDPLALHKQAETLLGTDPRQRFVVFVDQFEELFTQTRGEPLREAFVAQLIRAATLPDGRVTVMLSLRADFVAQCAAYPDLREAMSREFQLVGAMTPDELARAITLPVLKVGARIEPELVAQIVQDMKGEPGALPLVQFALRDLFTATATQKGSEITLTLEHYLNRGGVDRALERHADAVLAGLDERQRQVARTVFTRVVEIGSGRADTRRVASYDELTTGDVEVEQVEAVVQVLADEQARLLTTGEKTNAVEKEQDAAEAATTDGRTVTIAHERLIDAWPWLRRLIDENREIIALQNQIAADARAWEQNGGDTGYLYSGARLATAEEQMAAGKLVLARLSKDFVEAGIQRRKAAAQRARLAVAGLATIALIALLAAFFASYQTRLATARQIEVDARLAMANGNFRLATLLTLESSQREQSGSSELWRELFRLNESVLREISAFDVDLPGWRSGAFFILSPDGSRIASFHSEGGKVAVHDADSGEVFATLENIAGKISDVTWSPDGTRVAVTVLGTEGWQIQVWDVTEQRLVLALEERDSSTWSPGGAYLATVTPTNNKQIEIWNVDQNKHVLTLEGHSVVHEIIWSPNGDHISAVEFGDGRTLTIWRADGGEPVAIFQERNDSSSESAWSPDGVHLAFNGTDNRVHIWDATSNHIVTPFQDHMDVAQRLVWSPDGSRIAAVSEEGAVYVWEASSEEPPVSIIKYTNTIPEVAWSIDERLATSSDTTNIHIWDTDTGKRLATLDNSNAAEGPAWSPDGTRVAAKKGSTIHVWDATVGEMQFSLEHKNSPQAWFWTSKGSRLVSYGYADVWGSSDDHWFYFNERGWVRIWDASSTRPLVVLDGPANVFEGTRTHDVESISWNADGTRLASAIGNCATYIWDTDSGEELDSDNLMRCGEIVAWNPDSLHLLAFAGCGEMRPGIWDARSDEITYLVFRNLRSGVCRIAWSPDGLRLAWSDVNSGIFRKPTIYLSNEENDEILELTGHDGFIHSVRWSPDGSRLASASADDTVRVWNVHNGELLLTLRGNKGWGWDLSGSSRLLDQDGAISVAWSQDGNRLAAGFHDGSLHLWDADSGDALAILQGHTGRVNSLAWYPAAHLASASSDGTVRIWDANNGKTLATLYGHTASVNDIAWSPDGTRLASASDDNTVHIRGGRFLASPCNWILSNFTVAEWRNYFGMWKPYRPTCHNLDSPELPLWDDPFLTYQGWATVIGVLLLAVSLLVGAGWLLVRAARWTVRRVRRRVSAQG